MNPAELKEKYKKAHLELAKMHEKNKWDGVYQHCSLCILVNDIYINEFENRGKTLCYSTKCVLCTQHIFLFFNDERKIVRCTNMYSYAFCKHPTLNLIRAAYHMIIAKNLRNLPLERFEIETIINYGFPELFELDKKIELTFYRALNINRMPDERIEKVFEEIMNSDFPIKVEME